MLNLSSSQRIGEGTFQLRCHLDFVALREKLRCEYGPAAVRPDDIAGILSNVDKDLEDCGIEIDRLQSRLIVLQNQRQLLEEYRTRIRFLQSPIRRLPNETLMWIFDWACDMNELTSGKVESMPALAISSVCAHWRDLAKTCPSLWSRIFIAIQSVYSEGLPILDLYLESSGQSPLTIIIDENMETLEPHHMAVCAALVAQADRWQRLTVSDIGVHKALIAQSPRTYPALQTLIFPIFTIHRGLSCYKSSPQLFKLSACCIPSEKVATIQFPWKQLTSLSLAQHSQWMKNILSICENLTELQYKEVDEAGYCELSLPPTAAPVVETLVLSVVHTSQPKSLAEVVFASTTCPSLTTLLLETHSGQYRRPWPKEALHMFMSRSSCSLTTLSIKYIPVSDSDLIDLLRRIPSLLHLTLDDSRQTSPSPITPQFIQSLHAFPSPAASVLIQRLRSLHLTFSGSGFNDREFVDMLSSRWLPDERTHEDGVFTRNILDSGIGTLCLRSVVMCFKDRDMDENEYRRLMYLEKAGMRVALFNSGVIYI